MFAQTLRTVPRSLILACAFFFGAAYFAVLFPGAPCASAGSYLFTFLIALPSFVALWRYLGARRAAVSLASLSLFGYVVESVGVATGFPYGEFRYGDSLGPELFGLVPYLLPVSYAPLVIGAVAASRSPRLSIWTLKSSLLLVLMDGVLDPGAASLGFWIWPEGGAYYGVPASNYLGWLLSGALASALLLAVGGSAWYERPPLPGLLDGALIALSFWSGVALFAFLLRRRLQLRQGVKRRR